MVGRGGIDPEYFLDRMSFAEIDAFLTGFEESRRERWEQVRYIIFSAFQAQSTKPLDPKSVMSFAWDKKEEVRRATASERRAAWQKAAEMERILANQ